MQTSATAVVTISDSVSGYSLMVNVKSKRQQKYRRRGEAESDPSVVEAWLCYCAGVLLIPTIRPALAASCDRGCPSLVAADGGAERIRPRRR